MSLINFNQLNWLLGEAVDTMAEPFTVRLDGAPGATGLIEDIPV